MFATFRIVDKRPKLVVAGQADGVAPRTLEVLQVSELVISSESSPSNL